MIRATDSASTLELARYAEEQLRPLVDQLPGGSLEMDLHLGNPFFAEHDVDWSITVYVRENSSIGNQGDWVTWGSLLDTSEEMDVQVLKVREHLAKASA